MNDPLSIAAWCRNAMDKLAQIQGQPKHLGGLCAMASHFLFRQLQLAGYSPTFIISSKDDEFLGKGYSAHCWVRLETLNIDITATQFDYLNPIAPVYTYYGEPEEHPLLLKFFRGTGIGGRFPVDFNIFTYNKNRDIIKCLRHWDRAFKFSGENAKYLNRTVKESLCLI